MDKKKILIVDDEPAVVKVLCSRLEAWGYTCLTAYGGFQALEKVQQELPDLIILDIMMPKMDGYEVCRKLRADFVTSHIPIIVLTGKGSIDDIVSGIHEGVDDYITKPFDFRELQARIKMVLERAERQFYTNPLTRLPGNIAIEREIEQRISKGKIFSVCYYDIDNFKSFNDKYGYQRGDDVIGQTVRIILKAVRSYGGKDDFIGHIGGDDFVVITTPDKEQGICTYSIREIDRLIPLHYNKTDRKRGFVTLKNRRGKTEKFPLMSISIAIVTNEIRRIVCSTQVAEITSELKRYLKTLPGSNYLRDRRGKLPRKAKIKVEREKIRLIKKQGKPLGQILLGLKLITPAELEEAIRRHWKTGRKLGQIVVEMDLVKPQDIGQMLEEQLKIPYVSLKVKLVSPKALHTLSEEFIRANRALPLDKEEDLLSIAMIDPFDFNLIARIEKLTSCEVRPLIAMEQEFEQVINKLFK